MSTTALSKPLRRLPFQWRHLLYLPLILMSIFYLIPVFGVGAGAVAGDRLGAGQWLGALVVIGAVAAITDIRSSASCRTPSWVESMPSQVE